VANGGGPNAAQPTQSNPKVKAIMEKVGKGPTALQGSLGAALKQPEPAWETIQSKSKEYSVLASELGKNDPVRGDKQSWSKLTLAFADTASELDKAAEAKDMEKTKGALDSLGSSCMACHRMHRSMVPGGGRMGMGGPPPGMPPGGPPGGGRPGPPQG
jgi:cytochrome c556